VCPATAHAPPLLPSLQATLEDVFVRVVEGAEREAELRRSTGVVGSAAGRDDEVEGAVRFSSV